MSANEQPAASRLNRLLDEAVERGVVGVSAAIASSRGILWHACAGKASIQTGQPVHSEMLFGIGSITKTFVAIVILQLIEEEKLAIRDTAAGLLGAISAGIPNADRATIAQLLNHTSGVPSWEDEPQWIRDGRGKTLDVKRTWGKTDTLAYIRGRAPLAEAGRQFGYANTNYTLLGLIIERVTGQQAVTEIRRRILEPLDLRDIYLEGFEPLPEKKLPRRYHWATSQFIEQAGINQAFPEMRSGLIDVSASNLSVEWTAGGMVATARDLALYGDALRDGRLLRPESMALMTKWTRVRADVEIGHNLIRKTYGDGVAIVGHDGGVLGFTASLYWIEGTDVVVTVLCNVGSMHAGESMQALTLIGKQPQFVQAALQLSHPA